MPTGEAADQTRFCPPHHGRKSLRRESWLCDPGQAATPLCACLPVSERGPVSKGDPGATPAPYPTRCGWPLSWEDFSRRGTFCQVLADDRSHQPEVFLDQHPQGHTLSPPQLAEVCRSEMRWGHREGLSQRIMVVQREKRPAGSGLLLNPAFNFWSQPVGRSWRP